MKLPICIYGDNPASDLRRLWDEVRKLTEGMIDGFNLHTGLLGPGLEYTTQTTTTPKTIVNTVGNTDGGTYFEPKLDGSNTARGMELAVDASDTTYGKLCIKDSNDPDEQQLISLDPDSYTAANPGGAFITPLGKMSFQVGGLTSGTFFDFKPQSAVTLGGTTIGIDVDFTTGVTAGSRLVTGIRVQIPATTAAEFDGVGAIAIASASTSQRAMDVQASLVAGPIVKIRTGTTTPTGTVTGAHIDLETSVTAAAQPMTGLRIDTAAMTGVTGSTTGVVYIDSNVTKDYVLNLDVANKEGTIQQIKYGSAATTAAALIGVDLDLTTNITPGALAHTGMRISTPATTRANTVGEGSFVINSDATAARVIDIDAANTSGTIINLAYSGAVTHAGTLTGLNFDLFTNITAGIGQVATGIKLSMAGFGAGSKGLYIDSRMGRGISFQIETRQTLDQVVSISYGGTTTPNAITMMLLDLSTNVNTNTNANIGLDIPIVAADEDTTAPLRMNTMAVFVGTGAPNNANGANGDEYHRIDGAATTSIYKRIAGVWVGIA